MLKNNSNIRVHGEISQSIFLTQSTQLNVAKTVRINEETYRRLCEQAGELQIALKRSVSMDETIKYLTGSLKLLNKISDLAGSWKVSEKEFETIKKGLRDGWKTWRF